MTERKASKRAWRRQKASYASAPPMKARRSTSHTCWAELVHNSSWRLESRPTKENRTGEKAWWIGESSGVGSRACVLNISEVNTEPGTSSSCLTIGLASFITNVSGRELRRSCDVCQYQHQMVGMQSLHFNYVPEPQLNTDSSGLLLVMTWLRGSGMKDKNDQFPEGEQKLARAIWLPLL